MRFLGPSKHMRFLEGRNTSGSIKTHEVFGSIKTHEVFGSSRTHEVSQKWVPPNRRRKERKALTQFEGQQMGV